MINKVLKFVSFIIKILRKQTEALFIQNKFFDLFKIIELILINPKSLVFKKRNWVGYNFQ